jgi:tetratricopeptide (TPR) repeat protein
VTPRAGTWRLPALAVAVAVAPAAQDPLAAFDREYAAASAADSREDLDENARREAYRRALHAFLRVPEALAATRLPAAGHAAERAADLRLAAQLYASAAERDPGDAFVVEASLRVTLAKGDAREALARAHAQRDAHPAAVKAFLLAASGEAYGALLDEAGRRLRAGDTALGLFALESLADGRGSSADLCNHALALRFLGRLDESIARYRAALEREPDDVIAWNDLGLAQLAAGRRAAALESFRASVAREPRPGDGPGTTNLALLARGGQHDALPEPLVALRALVAQRPNAELARWLWLDAVLESRLGPAGALAQRHDSPARAR